jgi:hypothetical protein
MTNGEQEPPQPQLNFADSIAHNIRWIKQIAVDHDCSQGIAASAALMTMTMMDHHQLSTRLINLETDLAELKASLCQSNS